jgi:hypothetical protein
MTIHVLVAIREGGKGEERRGGGSLTQHTGVGVVGLVQQRQRGRLWQSRRHEADHQGAPQGCQAPDELRHPGTFIS